MVQAQGVAAGVWLRAIWESASDAIGLSGPDGVVVDANPAYYALYGYTPEEVLGKSFAIIFPEQERAAAEAQYRAVFTSSAPPPAFEAVVRRRDGSERIVESRVSFLEQNGQRVAMLSMVRDVTEAVTARHAMARAQSERSAFLTSLSHDIKNPLAAIKGHAQLLRRQVERRGSPPMADTLVQGLSQIEASALQVARLTDELVEVSRLGDGDAPRLRPSPADLIGLVQDAVNRHQRLADNHRLTCETEVNEVPGYWDVARLERVLDNLLSNAIKYSPEGGPITVRVALGDGPHQPPGPEIAKKGRVPQKASRPGVHLTIEDCGIGISPVDLPRVFDRFWRGDNVAQVIPGTGVGLASVKQIVEQHDGTVGVLSREGAGTRVLVWLPLWPLSLEEEG